MTRRTGLGRHRRIADSAGDPLDGLVNLFDIGIVLAVDSARDPVPAGPVGAHDELPGA